MGNDNSALYYSLAAVAGLLVVKDWLQGPADPGAGHQGGDEPTVPTLTLQRMHQLADICEEAFLGSWWIDDEPAATAALLECRNNADLIGVISVFGTRGWWWPHDQLTLPQWVTRLYDQDQKDELNAGLIARGISYTFP